MDRLADYLKAQWPLIIAAHKSVRFSLIAIAVMAGFAGWSANDSLDSKTISEKDAEIQNISKQNETLNHDNGALRTDVAAIKKELDEKDAQLMSLKAQVEVSKPTLSQSMPVVQNNVNQKIPSKIPCRQHFGTIETSHDNIGTETDSTSGCTVTVDTVHSMHDRVGVQIR